MFRSLFKKRPAEEPENFRDRVLKYVRASFPKVKFEVSQTKEDVILAKDFEIGLQNIQAKFQQSDRSQQSFEQIVQEHFQFVLGSERSVPDFATARDKLKPQIMPLEYTKQATILSFPFGRTLAIGIVLDMEEGYVYLNSENLAKWNKTEKELLDLAIANLDAGSRQMKMEASEGEEAKWVGIETKDGFDAARILIPNLRKFLASRLGSPFRFGIPNRDFLICWDASASARFSDFTTKKLEKDFASQPYPLSAHIFEIADDGTILELE